MADTRNYPKKSELVDENGNEPGENWRELRSPEGWAEERRKRSQADADYKVSGVGSKDRSVGEHIKAGARAIFEPREWRDDALASRRDRANPLYDRKKGKVED